MTVGSIPLASADMKIGGDGPRRNSTLICAPVMAETVDQMVVLMKKAKQVGADVVEIRLDYLKFFSPKQDLDFLIKQSPLPTLVTFRPKWEGGEYDGDENKRQEALRLAVELGADYVDIELQVAPEFINSVSGKKNDKVKIIVSSHNYESTPAVEDLGNLVARIQATGADIVKIATTALDITDSARVFQILAHSQVITNVSMKPRSSFGAPETKLDEGDSIGLAAIL